MKGYSPDIKLVFTVALKKELPIDYIRSHGVDVFTLRALKAGALKYRGARGVDSRGLVFIITGVGMDASRDTALWIRENIEPLFVVNLGTAGTLKPDIKIGRWVIPDSVSNEEGRTIPLDTRIPFPIDQSFEFIKGGSLLSLYRPRFYAHPPAWRDYCCLDMEAYAQAEVFEGTGISFHVIKWISDYSDMNTIRTIFKRLTGFRSEAKRLLSFIEIEKAPAISVVIPVHNRDDWLKQSLDSVLNQRLLPEEVIIVDDGSDKPVGEMLKQDRGCIKVIRLPENRGVSAARNIGVSVATSPWICFLDSDDLWKEEKLESQWRFLRRYPFYEILQCEEIWIRRGRRVNPCKHHKKLEGWIWDRCLERCMISPSAVMIKKGLFEAYGGFDESLAVCEDYDLWIRIARDKVVGLDPSPCVVKHGGHDDQLSRRYPAMDSFRVRALLKALEKEEDPEYRERLLAMLEEKLMILINGAKKRGNLTALSEYESILNHVKRNGYGDRIHTAR